MRDVLVRIRTDDGEDLVDVTRQMRDDEISLGLVLGAALAKAVDVTPDEPLAIALTYLVMWDAVQYPWRGDDMHAVDAAQRKFVQAADEYATAIYNYRIQRKRIAQSDHADAQANT